MDPFTWPSKSRATSSNLHTAVLWGYGCSPEDLPKAMNDRERWRERARDIRADGSTRWWWWLINKLGYRSNSDAYWYLERSCLHYQLMVTHINTDQSHCCLTSGTWPKPVFLSSTLSTGLRIYRVHPLQKKGKDPYKRWPGYDINLYLVVRFQFWSSVVCAVPLHCHYVQVHSKPER